MNYPSESSTRRPRRTDRQQPKKIPALPLTANRHLRLLTLAMFAWALLAAPMQSARTAITTSGNFKTGTPTPTLSITTPFTLTISTSGDIVAVAFDQWVTKSDGTRTPAQTSPSGQAVSYQINGGPIQMMAIAELTDNTSNTQGALLPNDGYLYLETQITVTVGQTLTFLPGTTTFASGGANFNPPPAAFTGNAFVADGNGVALSGNTSVNTAPEPTTCAIVGLGVAGLLGLFLRRRRAVFRG